MADDRTGARTGDEWAEQDMITTEEQGMRPRDTDADTDADADATVADTGPAPAPRRPDVAMLVIAAVTLLIAMAAFVGRLPDLSGVDLRWPLAIGMVLAGLALLAGTLRTRRR